MNINSVLWLYAMPALNIILSSPYLSCCWADAACVSETARHKSTAVASKIPGYIANLTRLWYLRLPGAQQIPVLQQFATTWPALKEKWWQIPRKVFCHRISSMPRNEIMTDGRTDDRQPKSGIAPLFQSGAMITLFKEVHKAVVYIMTKSWHLHNKNTSSK